VHVSACANEIARQLPFDSRRAAWMVLRDSCCARFSRP